MAVEGRSVSVAVSTVGENGDMRTLGGLTLVTDSEGRWGLFVPEQLQRLGDALWGDGPVVVMLHSVSREAV